MYVYMYIHIYNRYNPSQSFSQTRIRSFYCAKFVIEPVKGFHLVTKMQECASEFSR